MKVMNGSSSDVTGFSSTDLSNSYTIVYMVIMPFHSCTSGGYQEMSTEVGDSTITVKLCGGAPGAVVRN